MILKSKCLFSVYQLCLDEEGFNPPSWLCRGWSSTIAAAWKVLMKFPLGWGKSQHLCLSSAQVSLETPVLGEQSFPLGCTNATQILRASLRFMRCLAG